MKYKEKRNTQFSLATFHHTTNSLINFRSINHTIDVCMYIISK